MKITINDLIALNDEIISLDRAGVPLGRGLLNLSGDLPGQLARHAREIGERIDEGQPGQLKIWDCAYLGFFRVFCRLFAQGVGQFCSLGLDRGAEVCLDPFFDVLDGYVCHRVADKRRCGDAE